MGKLIGNVMKAKALPGVGDVRIPAVASLQRGRIPFGRARQRKIRDKGQCGARLLAAIKRKPAPAMANPGSRCLTCGTCSHLDQGNRKMIENCGFS